MNVENPERSSELQWSFDSAFLSASATARGHVLLVANRGARGHVLLADKGGAEVSNN